MVTTAFKPSLGRSGQHPEGRGRRISVNRGLPGLCSESLAIWGYKVKGKIGCYCFGLRKKMESPTLKSSVIKEKAGPLCGFPRFTIRQSFPSRRFDQSPGFDLHTKEAT